MNEFKKEAEKHAGLARVAKGESVKFSDLNLSDGEYKLLAKMIKAKDSDFSVNAEDGVDDKEKASIVAKINEFGGKDEGDDAVTFSAKEFEELAARETNSKLNPAYQSSMANANAVIRSKSDSKYSLLTAETKIEDLETIKALQKDLNLFRKFYGLSAPAVEENGVYDDSTIALAKEYRQKVWSKLYSKNFKGVDNAWGAMSEFARQQSLDEIQKGTDEVLKKQAEESYGLLGTKLTREQIDTIIVARKGAVTLDDEDVQKDTQEVVDNKTANVTNEGVTTSSTVLRPGNSVERRLNSEYGAMFYTKAVRPTKFIMSQSDLDQFYRTAPTSKETVSGKTVTLQTPAANALTAAMNEMKQNGITFSLRGEDPGDRSYQDTVRNWNSRVNPNLAYYVSKGKITQTDATRIKNLPVEKQVVEILKLEEQGLWFSTDRTKTILQSVAAPGASQHNFGLAIDVAQYGNPKVREILAKHGFFQTIYSDLPHFTYMGVKESELPSLGLERKVAGGQVFWVPKG